MKTDLAGLKKGEVVTAKVAERISSYEFLISISGQLIQIQNHTIEKFEVGSWVKLLVTGVRPLQLRLFVEKPRRSGRGINVSV